MARLKADPRRKQGQPGAKDRRHLQVGLSFSILVILLYLLYLGRRFLQIINRVDGERLTLTLYSLVHIRPTLSMNSDKEFTFMLCRKRLLRLASPLTSLSLSSTY